MKEAVRVRVRYYTPDEKGETRHERNERFGETSPLLLIPPIGIYLWNWYFHLSDRLRRCRDGICEPIPPSEFIAWRAATRNIVYPHEYDILCEMDGIYVAEMNKELADYREREKDRIANETKPGARKRR